MGKTVSIKAIGQQKNDNARSTRSLLQRENEVLHRLNDILQKAYDIVTRENDNLHKEIDNLQQARDNALKERDNARQSYDNLQRTLDNRKKSQQQKQSSLDKAQQRNDVIKKLDEQVESLYGNKMTISRRGSLMNILVFLCEKRSASVKEIMKHTRLSRASVSRYVELMINHWIVCDGWREASRYVWIQNDLKMP